MNLLSLVDILGGAIAVLAGMSIGRRMRPRPPEPLKPMCSCTHGYGTHDNATACQGQIKRESKWRKDTDPVRPVEWVHVPCPCLRYDGPSPAVLGLDIAP